MSPGREEERYIMRYFARLTLLCLVVVWGSMACAPVKPLGPTAPTGYFFSLRVSDPKIFLTLPGTFEHLPRQAELTVQVQNAQGQPVDGVTVEFEVAGMEIAAVTPQRVATRSGQARAVLMPSTIGSARVVAHVENMSQAVRFAVAPGPPNPPSP
jgi:Big-like domain-containing protein